MLPVPSVRWFEVRFRCSLYLFLCCLLFDALSKFPVTDWTHASFQILDVIKRCVGRHPHLLGYLGEGRRSPALCGRRFQPEYLLTTTDKVLGLGFHSVHWIMILFLDVVK